MADLRFYDRQGPFQADALAHRVGASLLSGSAEIVDVAAVEAAGKADLCYALEPRHLEGLAGRQPAAILIPPNLAEQVPSGLVVLVHAEPGVAFARAVGLFYPSAGRDIAARDGSAVASSARVAADAIIEAGAIIGPDVEIGSGSHIAANAVIGRGVRIGRNCFVGPNASITTALVGDRVIVLAGARIGNDGFGFVQGAGGLTKIPHVGRVILQDDVEVGANSTVDRGTLGDTVVGEGTKIDDQVHIAHNCQIGRFCIFAGKAALSGSVIVEDNVVFGGMAAAADHIRIGAGAIVAAATNASKDLPGGAVYSGSYPARPRALWAREMATLRRITRKDKAGR